MPDLIAFSSFVIWAELSTRALAASRRLLTAEASNPKTSASSRVRIPFCPIIMIACLIITKCLLLLVFLLTRLILFARNAATPGSASTNQSAARASPTDRFVLHLRQQMDMIGHQAVGVKLKGPHRFLALEKSKKLKMIIVRAEYAPAIIPASHDVVEPAGYFNSRLASHGSVS
jgi:hypothetical protein